MRALSATAKVFARAPTSTTHNHQPYPVMLQALRFEILRALPSNCRVSTPLAEKPLRVATVIDEEDFLLTKTLAHNRNVFIEERFHDWDHVKGRFTYYSRVATVADVLVVYELETVAPATAR